MTPKEARRVEAGRDAARNFLRPARARLDEARALFAPQRANPTNGWWDPIDNAALAERWESAAIAGLIPLEWVARPTFSFSCYGPTRWEEHPSPRSIGAAITLAADAAQLPAVLAIGAALVDFYARWYRLGHEEPPRGGLSWIEGGDGGFSMAADFRALVQREMTDEAFAEVPERDPVVELPAEELSPHLVFDPIHTPKYLWWSQQLAEVLRGAAEADAAARHGLGPYGRDPSLPNPMDLLLELWSMGYGWRGSWRGPSAAGGYQDTWLLMVPPDAPPELREGRRENRRLCGG